MPRLLIVDVMSDANYRAPYYRLFEEYGVECHYLVALPKSPELFGRQVRVSRSCSVGALLNAAVEWNREVKFDAVATVDELAVVPTAVIAGALGLPGNSLAAARNSRNKYLMRMSHAAGNAPHPQFGIALSLEEALDAAQKTGYPAVIKPTLGASSQHVYRINSAEEMKSIFPAALQNLHEYSYANMEADDPGGGPNGFIVEQYISGHEHCCEAIVWDGEVFIGSIADRLSLDLEVFDNDLYSTPTALPEEEIGRLKQAILLGAQAQGLKRSVLHAELKIDNGKPYIIEIACRFGGGSLFRMARLSYGYCPVWNTINVALDRKPPVLELNKTGCVTAGLTWISEPGKILGLEVPADIEESPELFNFKLTAGAGKVIRRPPHGNDVIGFIGTSGNSIEEAIAAGENVRRRINLNIDRNVNYE